MKLKRTTERVEVNAPKPVAPQTVGSEPAVHRGRPDDFALDAPSPLQGSEAPSPLPLDYAIRESIGIKNAGAEYPTHQEVEALLAQGKKVVFSDLALREAWGLGDKAEAFATRESVAGVVLSIDSYDTLDLDNAMSFRREEDGSWVVGVHAVDLSEWIRPGGGLDHSARLRGETKYLSDQGLVLPMLPLSLSEGKLSLFENKPRLTKSVELKFSPEGQLLSSRIFRSQLVNRFRLDEADASAVMNGGGRGAQHPELADALQAMCSLAAKVKGATQPGATMAVEKMLGLFTQLSAMEVGEALKNAELEASFRNQEQANARSLYGAEPTGHASVKAEAYATWTGPMRRYADLDVQRALDRMLDNNKPSGRKAEIDSRMRQLQLDRLNKVVVAPQTQYIQDLVEATRVPAPPTEE